MTDTRTARIDALVRLAARLTGLTTAELTGAQQGRPIVRARAAVAWAAKRGLGAGPTAIGRALGGRDAPAVRQLQRRANKLILDPPFARLARQLVDSAELL